MNEESGSQPTDIEQIVVSILTDAGEPVHYEEIAKQALQRGWQTRTKNAPATISVILSRMVRSPDSPKIKHAGERGYFQLTPRARLS